MQTLLLNANYEPIRIITWERAMYYLFTEKAKLVEAYAERIRSTSQVFFKPKIIILKKYIKLAQSTFKIKYSRNNIFKRDKLACQYCGVQCTAKSATLDHILPRSRGGKNTWTNVVTACNRCNNYKGDRTPSEAGMELLSKPKELNKRKFFEGFDFDLMRE